MIKIDTSTVINRPIEDVFQFTVSNENDAQWQAGVISSESTSVEVGSTFTQVIQFLGRRLELPLEITKVETNSLYGVKTIGGPIPMEVEFHYQTTPEGTKFRILIEGEPGGFFKLAEPLVARSTQRQWETNLANLKDLLEHQS